MPPNGTTVTLSNVTAPATVTVKFKDNIEISGNTSGAWKALKEEAEKPNGASTIIINGTIKATGGADSGQIDIGRSLTIKPKSGAAELDANQQSGIFKVGSTKTLTLKDGVTLKNGKAGSGGGVHVEAGGTFNMQGGTITACTATVNGGGVYVASGSTFTMSGSAKVDENNDVYLSNGTKIEVTGTLTHKPAAKITPADYTEGRVLATGTAAEKANFKVSPDSSGKSWRYKKVGDDIKFVKGKLTVTFVKLKCVRVAEVGKSEYYWTMKVDGQMISELSETNHWSANNGDEYSINKSFTRDFNSFSANETVPVNIEIYESDGGPEDHIGTTKANLTYDYTNDSWIWKYDDGYWDPHGNKKKNPNITIAAGSEQEFTEEYRHKDGDTDVTIKISWKEE